MINPAALSANERRLLRCYTRLGATAQASLLAFAEFLVSRSLSEAEAPPQRLEPVAIPASPGESVIGAIKRLSASYTMLDRQTMLHETAALMTQHVVQGRAASEVIMELELLFSQRYRQHTGSQD